MLKKMMLCALLLVNSSGAFSQNPDCPQNETLPGILPAGTQPLKFRSTDFGTKNYGVQTRFFYGNWEWRIDFGIPSYPKTPIAAEAIAQLAAQCLTSYPSGRIHIGFLAKSTGETNEHYLERTLDELVLVKRELLLTQQDLLGYLARFEPTGMSENYRPIYIEHMSRQLVIASTNLRNFGESNLLYLIESMSRYEQLNGSMIDSLALTRDFISYIGSIPDADLWAFDNLETDTNKVLTTFGLFFGAEERQRLADSLNQAKSEIGKVDIDVTRQNLESWARVFEETLQKSFDEKSPYFQAAHKLRFLFGTRDPNNISESDQVLRQMAGKSSSAAAIGIAKLFDTVTNDPKYWNGIHEN